MFAWVVFDFMQNYATLIDRFLVKPCFLRQRIVFFLNKCIYILFIRNYIDHVEVCRSIDY